MVIRGESKDLFIFYFLQRKWKLEVARHQRLSCKTWNIKSVSSQSNSRIQKQSHIKSKNIKAVYMKAILFKFTLHFFFLITQSNVIMAF